MLDGYGERVRNLTGKKDWRQTGDKEKGYVLQTRPMTIQEWGDKLTEDIVERPEHYFARVEIPRLDSDLDEFLAEQWDVQLAIREAQRTGRWFRTVSRQTCNFCSYFAICSEGRKIDPHDLPLGFEIVTDLHPELLSPDTTKESANVSSTTAPSSPAAAPAESIEFAAQTVGATEGF